MHHKLSLLILAFGAVGAISACGQKGPLYLPGDTSQAETRIPTEIPADLDELRDLDDDDQDEDENEQP